MSPDKKPRIVVLDSYTLNPGDLSWEPLESLGRCAIHARTDPDDVLRRAGDAEIVLTNKTSVPAKVIAGLARLRYVGVLATGVNVVDVEAARDRRIPVTNVPAYGTMSVAQMVFALLLHLTNHVAEHAESARAGRWQACADFCYWDFPLLELSGRTMGIVGYGRIGQATARLAQAFGMNVLAHTPRSIPPPDRVRQVDLETLLRQSDVVSLHCPLTDATHHLIDAARLELMQRTAILINTGRGLLVDESALADALNRGRLAGAGLDVLSVEPPAGGNPLLQAANCTVTPHIAWASQAARGRLMDVAVENVRAFLAGRPQNVVNPVLK